MRLRLIAVAAALLLSAGLAIISTSASADSGTQICGTQKCLNLWNGGPGLKTYSSGVVNDNYIEQFVKGRCIAGSWKTTANCPISGVPAGLDIVQISETHVANGNFHCVGDQNGDTTQADAESFDACNNLNTGQGGDYGTLFVMSDAAGCQANLGEFTNVHWSSNWSGGRRWLDANMGGNGNQFFLNTTNSRCYQLSNI